MSAVCVVLHDLLVALELRRDDLVPGDPKVVVDVVGMLLLAFIHFHAGPHQELKTQGYEQNK